MSSNDYVFYSIFIEGEKSSKVICELPDGRFLLDSSGLNCKRIFGLVPYEKILQYIDLINATLTRSTIVVREAPGRIEYQGYFIEGGAKFCLQEIAGQFIYVYKSEGESVEVGERIAHVVSGKLEVRNVRSRCAGRVTFIVDITWEEPRKTLLVVSNDLREVVVRKSS